MCRRSGSPALACASMLERFFVCLLLVYLVLVYAVHPSSSSLRSTTQGVTARHPEVTLVLGEGSPNKDSGPSVDRRGFMKAGARDRVGREDLGQECDRDRNRERSAALVTEVLRSSGD